MSIKQSRRIGDVVIVDMAGRLTAGERSESIQEAVRTLVASGHTKILLNLRAVSFIDSSRISQIVGAHASVVNKGGHLKLVNLTEQVKLLFEITRLFIALEVYDNEQTAIVACTQNPCSSRRTP